MMNSQDVQRHQPSAPAIFDSSWHLLPVQDQLYQRYGFSRTLSIASPQADASHDAPNSDPFARSFRDVQDPLPWLPDHVEAARHDCVTSFIDEVLLPRMRDSKPLTALELQRLTLEYKVAFNNRHPDDFGIEFEIIPAAEMELLELFEAQSSVEANAATGEYSRLLMRAALTLKRLLDENPDDLLSL